MPEHNRVSNFKIVTASQANSICKHKNRKNVSNVMAMQTFSLNSNVLKKPHP